MTYTVATITDIHGEIEVDFEKTGAQYRVSIRNHKQFDSMGKTFNTMNEAYAAFERLSKAIIMGEYSYEDRKAMLS